VSANAIRQAPGWWPNLVQAVCDACGWRGPVRNVNAATEAVLAEMDRDWHECGAGQ
jgi:hypothetical protein